MANPLYSQYGNIPNNMGLKQLWEQAQQLKQTIQNPKAEVERLLQSGAMSQSQFNQYSQIAQQVAQMMGRK